MPPPGGVPDNKQRGPEKEYTIRCPECGATEPIRWKFLEPMIRNGRAVIDREDCWENGVQQPNLARGRCDKCWANYTARPWRRPSIENEMAMIREERERLVNAGYSKDQARTLAIDRVTDWIERHEFPAFWKATGGRTDPLDNKPANAPIEEFSGYVG